MLKKAQRGQPAEQDGRSRKQQRQHMTSITCKQPGSAKESEAKPDDTEKCVHRAEVFREHRMELHTLISTANAERSHAEPVMSSARRDELSALAAATA